MKKALSLGLVLGLLLTGAQAQASTQHATKTHHHRGKHGQRGPRGPQGPEGPAGKEGVPGKTSLSLVDSYGTTAQLCNDGNCPARSTSIATCPTGYEVFGGGFDTSEGLGTGGAVPNIFPEATVLTDRQIPRAQWKVTMKVNPTAMVEPESPDRAEGSFVAFAVCGKMI